MSSEPKRKRKGISVSLTPDKNGNKAQEDSVHLFHQSEYSKVKSEFNKVRSEYSNLQFFNLSPSEFLNQLGP